MKYKSIYIILFGLKIHNWNYSVKLKILYTSYVINQNIFSTSKILSLNIGIYSTLNIPLKSR